MNLSRRAKLDRETPARAAAKRTGPVPAEPEAAAEPDVVAEPPTAPTPVEEPVRAEEEAPKQPRYVRAPAEKRAAAKPTALQPRSAKASGKLMSKNVTAAPRAAGASKGPKGGRQPITNTPKR